MDIYIEVDNAMGSRRGDVDDGFAVAALLKSSLCPVALGSCWGNTTVEEAHENNKRLGKLMGYSGPFLKGAACPNSGESEVSNFLMESQEPIRILALGPLTNVSRAIQVSSKFEHRVKELVVVGSNASSLGRWPPYWPLEFNLTKDRTATKIVFNSNIPLTFLSLDVAKRLKIRNADLRRCSSPLGRYLFENSRRWAYRSLFRRGSFNFPVWDLLAVFYVLEPSLVQSVETTAALNPSGHIFYSRGQRSVRRITGFNEKKIWDKFFEKI